MYIMGKEITKDNIRNFIQGNYYALKDMLGDNKIPTHIKEQAVYRALLCSKCLVKGSCEVCGCSTPNMFFSPLKTDPRGLWSSMLGPDKWKQEKIKLGIIDPNYFKITFKEIKEVMQKQNLRYFKPTEFVMGGKLVFDKMNSDFLSKLDELRNNVGQPISILSSYRSPSYNSAVGGVRNSYHLQGRAVDIKCPNSSYRAKVIKEALNMGLTVGVMRTSLHIDDRKDQILFHYYPRYGDNNIEDTYNG